jgi:hypothetical protein
MEDWLRGRIVDALQPTVPRVAELVANRDRCWGDIAESIERGDLCEEEQSALLEALVGLRDRNALLLFASIFGVDRLAPRGAELPVDLQVWLAAEGHTFEGASAAATVLAGSTPEAEQHRARERAIFRAAANGLRSLRYGGAK